MNNGDPEGRYGLPLPKTNPESRLVQLRKEELMREFLGFFEAVSSGLISPEQAAEEQVERYLKLEEENGHDPLTGLLNRRGFFEVFDTDLLSFSRTIHLAQESTQKQDVTFGCLVLMDLDNFGVLNKSKGDSFGDLTLQQVAIALINGVRPDDHVARFGGEEFMIFLRGTNLADGGRVVERLRGSLSEHTSANLDYAQTGTFAIIEFPRGLTAEQLRTPKYRESLFKQAYDDVIEAKNEGKQEGRNVTMTKIGPNNFQRITLK